MTDSVQTAFQLSSLQKFFHEHETQIVEQFSSDLIEFVRQNSTLSPSSKQTILQILKLFESVSEKTHYNLVLFLAVRATEVPTLEEKRELTDTLDSLVHPPYITSQLLEVTARALVNQSFEETQIERQRHYVHRVERLTHYSEVTSDVFNVYAHGLFSLNILETELKRKYVPFLLLEALARKNMHNKEFAPLFLYYAKAHVNMAHFDPSIEEKQKLTDSLIQMKNWRQIPNEIFSIIAKALSNLLDEDLMPTVREYYFKLFARFAVQEKRNWDFQQTFANTLFNTALQTEDLAKKRFCARELKSIALREGCTEEIKLCCAHGIFNQIIDEKNLISKRAWLAFLKFLSDTSDDPMLVHEYARALVNLAVDDTNVEKKRSYIQELQRLAESSGATLEITLEYTKGLTNLALCIDSIEEKIQQIEKTLNTIEKWRIYSNKEAASETLMDFMCIYAGSLALYASIENNASAQRQLLEKIPPVEAFQGSDYVPFVQKFLQETQDGTSDVLLKRQTSELLDQLHDQD